MRIIGLDVGTKRIGVAVSDESRFLARGREVIERKSDRFAIKRVKDIIEEENATRVVVGLPVNMDGTKGPRAKDSEDFAEKLKQDSGITINFWDERLSTREAEDILLEASVSREKRKKVVDKIAAQIILQGYLDNLRAQGKDER